MPVSQVLALFTKVIRKITKRLLDVQKEAISATIPEAPPATSKDNDADARTTWQPVQTSLDDELREAGDEATRALREKQKAMLDSLDLSK